MSDISNQLIKDSYDYVLQSDLITGIVYRIGGQVPINPKFISGLTVNSGFTFSNGTEQLGYVLTCDALGNANWSPMSAATPSSGVTSIITGFGLSGDSTTGAVTIINTLPDQTVTITGGTNIEITGIYPNFGVNFTGSTSGGSISGLTYYVSASTPTGSTLISGDRWFNTSTGIELVWINDGDSQQWIQPFSVPGPVSPDVGFITTTAITNTQTINWDKTYWGISGTTNVDITLPSTVSKEGYYLIIKDEAGICGTYRIRLIPSSGKIDGNNYVDMNINFMSLTCLVRGGNWFLI